MPIEDVGKVCFVGAGTMDVDRGHLGLKSGRGFYTYPDPVFRRPDFLSRGG